MATSRPISSLTLAMVPASGATPSRNLALGERPVPEDVVHEGHVDRPCLPWPIDDGAAQMLYGHLLVQHVDSFLLGRSGFLARLAELLVDGTEHAVHEAAGCLLRRRSWPTRWPSLIATLAGTSPRSAKISSYKRPRRSTLRSTGEMLVYRPVGCGFLDDLLQVILLGEDALDRVVDEGRPGPERIPAHCGR